MRKLFVTLFLGCLMILLQTLFFTTMIIVKFMLVFSCGIDIIKTLSNLINTFV